MYLPNINLTKKSKTDEQTTTAVQHTEGKIIYTQIFILKFFLRLKISYSKQKVQTYQNEKTNKKKTHYLLFQVKSHMLDFTFISVCSFFSFFFLL